MLTAIETTGTIEQNGRIVIDETFAVDEPTSVRVIVVFPESEDINENEWRRTASKNKAFRFSGRYGRGHLYGGRRQAN